MTGVVCQFWGPPTHWTLLFCILKAIWGHLDKPVSGASSPWVFRRLPCFGCLCPPLQRYSGMLVLPPWTLCSSLGVCLVAFCLLQFSLASVLLFLLVLLFLQSFYQVCEALCKVYLTMCLIFSARILSLPWLNLYSGTLLGWVCCLPVIVV